MLNENDIQKKVLEKIHTGNVAMHSRIFFILRAVLIGVIAVFVLAISLFALSFAFFSIHASGARFLLEFGSQGFVTFVTLFPWTILFLFVVLLVVLELVMHHYTPAYRFSLLRIFLWVLCISVVGSTLIVFTPLHSFLLHEADNARLPLIGPLYERVHDSHLGHGVYRGAITSLATSTFIISRNETDRDTDEGSWSIVPPAGFDLGTLSVGEKVYVAGRLQNGTVHAYGVRIVPNKQ